MPEIEARNEGDLATTDEFASYFVDMVGLVDEEENVSLPLKIADVVRRNLEVEEVKILGHGSFGAAGLISGTREVLKLTTDVREMKSAAHLIGAELANVVSYYAAGMIQGVRLRNAEDGKPSPVGASVQGFVDTVGLGSLDMDEALNLIVAAAKRKHRVFIDEFPKIPEQEVMERLEAASGALAETLDELGWPYGMIAAGLRQLMDAGVFAVDVHARNVGRDNQDNQYKIFDIGVSSVRAQVRTAVLRGRRP